jgi:hypothetical protein
MEEFRGGVSIVVSPALQRFMDTFASDKFLQDPRIKRALKQGVAFLVREGRKNLKAGESKTVKHTGNLLKSMYGKVKRSGTGALAGFSTSNGRKGYHGVLVDRGTAERYTSKGYYRGRSGYGKHSDSHSLGFWTDVRNQDADEALTKVEDGITIALSAMG